MSNLANRRASSAYTDSLEATEELSSPALGFIDPTQYRGPTASAIAQIKQVNTLICLVVDLTEKVEALTAKVRSLEAVFKATEKDKGTEELLRQLQGLKLGETSRPPQKEGTLRVFVDPKTLVEKARNEKR
nr:putative nucleic acid binding protein [Cacao mild mosaic virus]